MREESHQSFPQNNPYNLLSATIITELNKVGIVLVKIETDMKNNACTLTTNKPIPDTKQAIQKAADDKGITIKFLTSE